MKFASIRSLATCCIVLSLILTSCSEEKEPARNNDKMTKPATFTMADLKKQRKEMAHRKRRIIFNNDGDDIAMLGKDAYQDFLKTKDLGELPVTAEGLLKARTTALLGSQVDAIWYHTTYGVKIRYSNGPFGRLYGSYEPDDVYATWDTQGKFGKLMATEGKDALEIMIEACRKQGIEIFYSNRMNDTHDSIGSKLTQRIKVDHPEYTLSTKKGKKYSWTDVRFSWSALNFEHDQVRQMMIDALREVCRTYDIDGIELDFLRGPPYFPPTMEHKAVEQKHFDLMNDMVRKIRKMTEEEGLRRGRPILVAAHAATDIAYSLTVGLDVETWLKEGLIDILTAGNYGETTPPMKPLFDLAHRYQVTVYPWVAAVWPKHEKLHYPIEPADIRTYRGDAMFRFLEGADGVYMFNVFDPTSPLWWELGDPAKLAVMDKTYVWDYLPSHRKKNNLLCEAYNVNTVAVMEGRRRVSVTVTDKGCEPIPLFVGEDLSAVPPAGKKRKLTLVVGVKGLPADNTVAITVNSRALAEPKIERNDAGKVRLRFEQADPSLFKKGENAVEAALAKPSSGSVQINNVRLYVRY